MCAVTYMITPTTHNVRRDKILVELLDYQPKFDEDYLQGLIRKATPKWRGVNADEWLANVRGM